ncbi:phospholipase A1 [Xenorhabdus beddingii]|uniref:Phospholipase A1 n=1 Tax=Xenorhabdus beddingii TaxID=40578 RepID=A0A1Y2SUG1_9GAMM|nr:hypothetical protein [Xenorhabdus beddingii]OTA21883.1 phospholipase A1 [Xenorhabdus beddingii]
MYTEKEAAELASLVLYASDMNAQYYNDPTPPPDPRIEEDEWELKGYIWGNDLTTKTDPETHEKTLFHLPTNVCYGYVAEMKRGKGRYVVVIRGTDPTNLLEIIQSLDSKLVSPWINVPNQKVHAGFFKAYRKLKFKPREAMPGYDYNLVDLPNGLAGFISLKGGYTVTIIGHSLGAAIASYLMYDIAPLFRRRFACLFACPRPGNQTFANSIQECFFNNAANYEVINYTEDLVPHYPPEVSGYASLSHTTHLSTPDNVNIPDGLVCNHILASYIARLDFDKYKKIMASSHTKIRDSCVRL